MIPKVYNQIILYSPYLQIHCSEIAQLVTWTAGLYTQRVSLTFTTSNILIFIILGLPQGRHLKIKGYLYKNICVLY